MNFFFTHTHIYSYRQRIYKCVNTSRRWPEEELPGDLSRVGQARLRHLRTDRVDDCRLFLVAEERRDGAGDDELSEVDEEILMYEVLLLQHKQHLLSLGKTQVIDVKQQSHKYSS